jgi:serine/threonine-protein kinase
VSQIRQDGFEPKVIRLPNGEVQPKYVFEQEPSPGTGLPNGSIVTIHVSTGKRKIAVPSLVGKPSDTAVAELTSAGLDADVREVPSDKRAGTVTAQNPGPGTVIVEGSSVRINVSAARSRSRANVVGSS